jgi:integrase
VTARKASLRVAHGKGCPQGGKTSLDSLTGCNCLPSFYVSWRDASGAARKSPRVKDRREAEKALRAQQVEIDRGRVGTAIKDIEFPAWVDMYLNEILPSRPGIKGTTERTYRDTLERAVEEIGHVKVREVGNPELRRFHATIAGLAPDTQVKHLSALSACFTAAIEDGYCDANPVSPFRKRLRLKRSKGTPPYTDGEVARLLAALRNEDDLYCGIVRVMLETGARMGEAIGLDWSDVDLLGGKLEILHTYGPDGLTIPKDSETRTVYLTARALRAFAWWTRRTGVRETGPVFATPAGSYIDDRQLRRIVERAINAAGIPKVNPEVSRRPRKTLHSLRATYTRRALEAGMHPQFIEAMLGHSSLDLTIGTYGAWSESALRAEAQGARLRGQRGRDS